MCLLKNAIVVLGRSPVEPGMTLCENGDDVMSSVDVLFVKWGRVDAVVCKFLELGYDSRAVFLECDTEPS